MKTKRFLLDLRRRVILNIFILLGICLGFQSEQNTSLISNAIVDSFVFIKASQHSKLKPTIGTSKDFIPFLIGTGLDTLRNHDGNRASPFRTCSLFRATRLTMPAGAASACTIKTVRFAFQHYTYASCPCSLYVWRDTIVNGIHRPGYVRYRVAITVPSDAPGDWSWYYHNISSALIFNPNEHFWIGSMQLTRDVAQCVDGSDNPDTTRNMYRYTTGSWRSNHTDYFMEAIVSYVPLNNNIGALGIEGIEKVTKSAISATIKARVKNFGRNTLAGGIPVILKITGPSLTYADTEFTSVLLGDSTQLIAFAPDWLVPDIVGDFQIVVWTNLSNDPIRSNDTTKLGVFVYTHGHRESFEDINFPPAGWSVFNFNGINQWSRDTFLYYTSPSGARIAYDQTPFAPNNDWFVSPRIFAQPHESIIFWYRARFSNYVETLLVRISFADFIDTSNFIIIDRIVTNSTDWQRRIIPINIAQAANIFIAFHYPSYNKSSIYLDDIITPEPLRFIDFYPVRIDAPKLPIIVDSTYPMSATYRNNSIDDGVVDIRVFYEINGRITHIRDSVLIMNMGSGDMPTINFRNFTTSVIETLQLKIWTSFEGDENHGNDTITRAVIVSPYSQTLPYWENFDEDWGPFGDNPPFGGWRIVDDGGEYYKTWNTNDWYKDTVRISDTKLREVAKVFYSPREDQLEKLISPRMNCSNHGIYNFSYWHWYLDRLSSSTDSGLIMISNNDGASWTTIARFSNMSDSSATTHNITNYASGYSKVRICFQYSAYDEYWWCIDDFAIDWIPFGPILLEPSNGFITASESVFFRWQPIPGISSYELQISYDSLFQIVMLDDTIYDTNTEIPLEPATYWWRVRTQEPIGLWTEFRRLTVLPPPPPPTGWFKLADVPLLPSSRGVKDGGALSFCLLDSCIYVLKGNNTRDFYAYKINDSSWSRKESIGLDPFKIRKVRKGGALCFGNNLIYATKGNSTNEFWAYNPTSNTWSQKRNIPGIGIKGGTGLVYIPNVEKNIDKINVRDKTKNLDNGLVYLLKGSNNYYEFYAYSISNDTWERKADAPSGPYNRKFRDGSALVFDGVSKIYAIKGSARDNEFYYYDINSNVWSLFPGDTIPKKMNVLSKRYTVKDGGALAFLDNTVYAIKGGGCPELWSYQITNGEGVWIPLDTIPRLNSKSVPKTGAALVAGIGSINLLKGNNTVEFWSYLPLSSKGVIVNNQAVTTENILSEPVSLLKINKLKLAPNPCNTFVNIVYSTAHQATVSLKLYDVSGKLVNTILNRCTSSGEQRIRFFVNDLSVGVYFVNFDNGQETRITKLIVQ